jgi:hypothetical protein
MADTDSYICTAALRPKRPLPGGAPQGEPHLMCSVIERAGTPVALTMTFEHDSPDPSIAEETTVAYTDGNGRLLELTTTKGFRTPPHIVRQAKEQGRWIELTVPVKVVAWHRKDRGNK